MNEGVIYVAFGMPYLVMAQLSCAMLKKSNPGMPVTVVTNVCRTPPFDDWAAETDTWVFENADDSQNRLYKTNIFEWSPYRRTLYVDCDTLVVGDLSGIFKILEHADIALMTRDGGLGEGGYGDIKILDSQWALSRLPHWNGGVVGFRDSPEAQEFFHRWGETYVALGHKRDQPALAEALILSKCRFLSFDSRWNMLSVNRRDWDRGDVKVIHYVSELDFLLERKLLHFAKRLGNGAPEAVKDYLLGKRRFRRKKLGLVNHLFFKLRQSIAVGLHPPALWRNLR
jgi:hypothetical protein